MPVLPDLSHVVLVVDDEAILRLNASEALRDEGCTTYEAGDTEEALMVLSDHPDISLLFTDINMPGDRDGMALAEAVHAQRPEVQLIITSGRQQPAPADIPDDGQFIPKPYSLEVLTSLVATLPRRK
jgi:CheY-like chemotaxis protein